MSRRALLASLLALAVLAVPALAAVRIMTGDPPPDLAELISAERRFAARAAQTSIRDAFVEALDDNGIVFRPGPVNGKEFYGGRPSNPGPKLAWQPTYAEISQFGDLGWTTGPYEFTNAGEKKPSAYGHFATVWQYGLDHRWHVMIDCGHAHPKAAAAESLSFARVGGEKSEPHVISLQDLTGGVVSLHEADTQYSDALARQGLGAALAAWGDGDVRVYRDDQMPLVGAAAAGKALPHEWDQGVAAWDVRPGAIAKSGDLAFTYGTVDLSPGSKGDPARRNVLRIWRRPPGEGWKLALDVTVPAPPEAAAQAPPKAAGTAQH